VPISGGRKGRLWACLAAAGAALTIIPVELSSLGRRRRMRQDFDRFSKLQIVLPAKVFGVLHSLIAI
jgi:hypothetical protein